MAKIVKVEIQLDRGQVLSLTANEAQELYTVLKAVCELKAVYMPYPQEPKAPKPA